MEYKVSYANKRTKKKIHLVTFTLSKKGVVLGKWSKDSALFEQDVEQGIVTGNGKFFMKDGKKFLDNLELAYANSSTIVISKS